MELDINSPTRELDVADDLLQNEPLPLQEVASILNASIGNGDSSLTNELIQSMVCAEHTLQLSLSDAMNIKVIDSSPITSQKKTDL